MNIKSIGGEANHDAVLLRNAANGRIVSNSSTHPAATRQCYQGWEVAGSGWLQTVCCGR